MALDTKSITLLSFDCYGTLIDWEQGIADAIADLCDRHGVICGRDQILELYGRCEAAEESSVYRPYREILRSVSRRMANEFGIQPTKAEHLLLENSLANWQPFDDTVEALKKLKSKYRLAIISNIDNDLFEGSAKQLQVPFDFVITAAQVKAYKPSITVFEQAQARMGIKKANWLHVAQSKFHDIAPTNRIGLQSVWINRRHSQPGDGATPESPAVPTLELPDLASLAALLAG
jgi:2-haloacid dehalogenase